MQYVDVPDPDYAAVSVLSRVGLRTCWRVSAVLTRKNKASRGRKKRKGRGVNGAPGEMDVSSLTLNKMGGGEGEKKILERDSVEKMHLSQRELAMKIEK